MAKPSRIEPPSPSGAIRVFGPPHQLRLAHPALEAGAEAELVVSAYGKQASGISLRKRVSRRGMRLRIERDTPPGLYQAQLRVGDTSHPVEIEVAAAPRLRAQPAASVFEGNPGEDSEIKLTLSNAGNVPITIPDKTALGLYDDNGIEAAFSSTYRQETDNPDKLLGHWLLKLREGYGGLLKLFIVEGAGDILPGEQKTLRIRTSLPSKLKPGHGYHGVLKFETLNQAVRIRVGK